MRTDNQYTRRMETSDLEEMDDDIFACDEGEDISQYHQLSMKKIKAIFEMIENHEEEDN